MRAGCVELPTRLQSDVFLRAIRCNGDLVLPPIHVQIRPVAIHFAANGAEVARRLPFLYLSGLLIPNTTRDR
jgi:hypothetical protein